MCASSRVASCRHRNHRSSTSAVTSKENRASITTAVNASVARRRDRRRGRARVRCRRRSSCRPTSAPTLIPKRNSKPLAIRSSFSNGTSNRTSRVTPPPAHANAKLHVEVDTTCQTKSRSAPTAARSGSPGCGFLEDSAGAARGTPPVGRACVLDWIGVAAEVVLGRACSFTTPTMRASSAAVEIGLAQGGAGGSWSLTRPGSPDRGGRGDSADLALDRALQACAVRGDAFTSSFFGTRSEGHDPSGSEKLALPLHRVLHYTIILVICVAERSLCQPRRDLVFGAHFLVGSGPIRAPYPYKPSAATSAPTSVARDLATAPGAGFGARAKDVRPRVAIDRRSSTRASIAAGPAGRPRPARRNRRPGAASFVGPRRQELGCTRSSHADPRQLRRAVAPALAAYRR